MENLVLIFVAAFIGTTLMTWFSYFLSELLIVNWKEPRLLVFVLYKLNHELSYEFRTVLAWIIHYVIGVVFAVGYNYFWMKLTPVNFLTSLLYGAICGIIGIVGWRLLFILLDTRLPADAKGYFMQLFFAHLIFAIGIYGSYVMLGTYLN